jgi:hypothetical protein
MEDASVVPSALIKATEAVIITMANAAPMGLCLLKK